MEFFCRSKSTSVICAALVSAFLIAGITSTYLGSPDQDRFQSLTSESVSDSLDRITGQATTQETDTETVNLQTDLQSYYRFDNPEVSKGYSLEFDGSDDYIEISESNTTALDVDNLTFMAWIKTDGASTGNMIMNKEGTYELAAGSDGISMAVQAQGCSGWCSGWGINDAGNVSSRWTHVAGTWNGTTMTVYKNGDKIDSRYFDGAGPIDDTDRDLGIGARDVDQTPSSYFEGAIDNPIVYSRPLSESEIRQVFEEKHERNPLPSSCSDLPKDSESGTYTIDPNGGSLNDAFEVYCDMETKGGGWMKVWFTQDKRNGFGFVACESSKWDGKWSSNPLVDLDPDCSHGFDSTFYSLDYYDSNGNSISEYQIRSLSSNKARTVYDSAFHFYDADNNCDNGREPITTYNNSGPSGNSLNIFPTQGSPENDSTHIFCGGGNSDSSQTISVNWQTVMKGGVPTRFGLQSGSGDTGCWNCSDYSPGYGSTVELNETYFWVRDNKSRRDTVLDMAFDDFEGCDLTSGNSCIRDNSFYAQKGTPVNFDDNNWNTGSGWIQETPLNRPLLSDYSIITHNGAFYGGINGHLKNFNFSQTGSEWVSGKVGDHALQFDGSDDTVNIDGDLPEKSPLSIIGWIWINSSHTKEFDMIGNYNGSDGLIFRTRPSNSDRIELWFEGGHSSAANAVPERDEWVQIGATLENGTITYYKNGEVFDTVTTSDSIVRSPNSFKIGSRGDDISRNDALGKFDNIKFYNRSLTDSEVKSLYSGKPVTKNLVGRWDFEAGDRKTAYDTSSLNKSGIFDTPSIDFNHSEYMRSHSGLSSKEFTLSLWADLDDYSYFDNFSSNTSERYFVEEYTDRGSGSGFIWDTGSKVVESDTSNDDINLLKNSDLEWPLVYTEARTGDNDGVGVMIDNGTYIYEAVVANDHPGNTGIYRRTTGDSSKLIEADNSYDVNNWHRIGLGYNGSHLKMYVDGSLEAVYRAGYLDPESIGLVSDANSPSSIYRYLEAHDNKAVVLGNSPKTFALSKHADELRGYYDGKHVSVPKKNGLAHYALSFNGTELSIFRQGEKYGSKSVDTSSVSRGNILVGKNLGMKADEVKIYNRSLSEKEVKRLAFQ